MNENDVGYEVVEPVAPSTQTTSDAINKPSKRVVVNFFLPDGVDVDNLTIDNYREVTGKRFRMTNDQAKVRKLTREESFTESKALAISQRGTN